MVARRRFLLLFAVFAPLAACVGPSHHASHQLGHQPGPQAGHVFGYAPYPGLERGPSAIHYAPPRAYFGWRGCPGGGAPPCHDPSAGQNGK